MMPEIYNPHGYQERAHDWTMSRDFSALWMEPGLGKTVVTLTALEELQDRFHIRRTLLVAPLRVANSTWPDEIAKWDHTYNMPYSVITGTQQQRLKALASKAPLHIINFDNIVWLVKHILTSTGGRWPYDSVVVDESSWVKNQDSKRCKALTHIRPALDFMLQLTGSPAANGLLNLWSQLYMLEGPHGPHRLGNTFKAMKDRWWQQADRTDYGPTYEIKPGASTEIYQRVSDIALSMRSKDYLDLPECMTVPIRFDLPKPLQEQYDYLEANMWLELKGKNIEAVNGGALTMKCRQFANGFLYDEEKAAHKIHDLKLKALDDIVSEAVGQPLLIGYQYKQDLKEILKRYPHAQQLSEDPQMIRDWNAGKIPILLAHPKSAGHGLNMQDGGHMIVLFGLDWSLELYEQMIQRLDRQGQKYPVMVYLLMARHTIDELILLRIEAKNQDQNALKSAVHKYQTMRMAA